MLGLTGCQAPEKPAGQPVHQAVAQPTAQRPSAKSKAQAIPTAPPDAPATPAPSTSPSVSPDPSGPPDDVIAYVNHRPISRARVVDLLLAGHGVGILEQIVVLEQAKRMAAEQGIEVSRAEIDAEFDRSLRNLVSPLRAADEETSFDREEAEGMLDEILARRNISRAECLAVVTRNAYLRAIVDANLTFSDDQLGEEYLRSFSRRVAIRHIQFASLSEAERIRRLLDAGEDFAAIAQTYSANLRTGPGGGRLRPFAQNDADVPAALREAAFGLEVGEVSAPIRVDDWYHIIQVERFELAETRTAEEMKPELEIRLRQRLTAPAMETLYRNLFNRADIRIIDKPLADEFKRKHPNRGKNKPDPARPLPGG